jgi:hypothetical protein
LETSAACEWQIVQLLKFCGAGAWANKRPARKTVEDVFGLRKAITS